MFHPADASGHQDPAIPAWLAHDLGLDPSTPASSMTGTPRRRRPRPSRRAKLDAGLATMPLLEGLSPRELRLVSQLTTPVPVRAATTLAKEGTAGREFFLVLDGEVEVRQGDEVVARRGPGAHVGEIAMLTSRPRNATLVTSTAATVRVASAQEFRSLVRALPGVEERLLRSMVERAA